MFALVKNSFNSFWKGDTTSVVREGDVFSDEGFLLVPAVNRKRNSIASSTTAGHDHDAKIKKGSECSSISNESHMAASYSSLNTEVNEAEMPSSMQEECTLRQEVESAEISPLEGVPFIATPYLKQVHDLLRDYPPVCPNLPSVTFDFALEKTVLRR